MTATFDQVLADADRARAKAEWAKALGLYRLAVAVRTLPEILLNMAVCHAALGESEAALGVAQQAFGVRPDLWQAGLLAAALHKERGRPALALGLLERAHGASPDSVPVRLRLAGLTLNFLGDARRARALVQDIRADAPGADEAAFLGIAAQLYDRDVDAAALTAQIRAFAARELPAPALAAMPALSARARPRIGLISSLFCRSPVYFFCATTLEQLSRHADLVFFDRGTRRDEATLELKRLARDWQDVQRLDAAPLTEQLRRADLDLLLDLEGWSDLTVMRALSRKPARRLVKWVGGQSASSGLSVYDGFLADEAQVPVASRAFYSEPLLTPAAYYVDYRPPAAVAQQRERARVDAGVVGVISNPAKVSRGFIETLVAGAAPGRRIRFIDHRYREPLTRERIERELDAAQQRCGRRAGALRVEFASPASHDEYLAQVAAVGAVYDTFPYGGGLTLCEALSLGKVCCVRGGHLMSERHALSHIRNFSPFDRQRSDAQSAVLAHALLQLCH